MLQRLSHAVVRHRRLVLAVAVVGLALAGAFGGGVASELSSGGFDDPSSESALADQTIREVFGQAEPNLVLLVTANEGSVDDPAVAAAGMALTEELAAEEGIEQATSYWALGSPPPLKDGDGMRALVLARTEGDDDAMLTWAEEHAEGYTRTDGAITVAVTGPAQVFSQMTTTIERDLARAEAIAIPVTLVLMVFIFGSVVAASLPLAVGVIAILGTFLVLRIVAAFTDVSIFALNLTTGLGLGLAIDYALFIVSRFREELAHGHDPHTAVRRTIRTAGRTVAFSAATVAVSLAALLVFPLSFLRSFAYAGIPVVAIAGIGAVVVLPALLAVIGRNVDRLRVIRRSPDAEGKGYWHRSALFVMRRPWPVATAVIALLAVLGAPFLGIEFGIPDDRSLPQAATSRVALDTIREEFSSFESAATSVVATGIGDPASRRDDIAAFATDLSRIDGVARVDAVTGSYVNGIPAFPATPSSARFAAADGTWFSVVPEVEPISPEGEAIVTEIRAMEAPFDVLVGGGSAELVDSKTALFGRLPLALGLIGVVTFVVLFLMFGSLLVPTKAVVLNLLSLSATFGAMVWVFQDGHLAGLLGFTPVGTIAVTMPILMFCIAFGLSMDYEVFLLSRIKEEHDLGGDNVTSVAVGLEKTGRIVTSAALLIAIVFAAMATSGVRDVKLFGIGLALAVVTDAFLIRGTLVPAFMRLAGAANWWAPARLRRLHERIGLREGGDLDAEAGQPAPAPAAP
ncbi:MAG: MMPL family transporter [Nitriliruptorales bacterium]